MKQQPSGRRTAFSTESFGNETSCLAGNGPSGLIVTCRPAAVCCCTGKLLHRAGPAAWPPIRRRQRRYWNQLSHRRHWIVSCKRRIGRSSGWRSLLGRCHGRRSILMEIMPTGWPARRLYTGPVYATSPDNLRDVLSKY